MRKTPTGRTELPRHNKSLSLSVRLETVRTLNEINSFTRARRKYTTNIQHIAEALIATGYTSLDKQAKALGIIAPLLGPS
jgi:hypothetical protein